MYNNTSAALMLQTMITLLHYKSPGGTLTTDDIVDLETCYGKYGCFSNAYPFSEGGRLSTIYPESPKEIQTSFATFTRRNRDIPVILKDDDIERIRYANIDPRGPFYLIAHGFSESANKPWIENMTHALLNLEGNEAATVFAVDWSRGASPGYGQSVANIRLVGVIAAHFIHNVYEALGLTDLDNFHFIGHSLGAHLAGYCGHTLQQKFNLKLGRITGLDPAGPDFQNTVSLVRLDRSDAKYVDIIHTCTIKFTQGGLGIPEPIGHVDFYPNGGEVQPGCEKPLIQTAGDFVIEKSCHHDRSHEYFTESIAPSCPFMAIQCESYQDFLAGNCISCDNHHLCMPMGYHSHLIYKRLDAAGKVHPNRNLVLYSLTGSSKPFCRVHYKVTVQMANTTKSRATDKSAKSGQLFIKLVDKFHGKSDVQPFHPEPSDTKSGVRTTNMMGMMDTGHPPVSLIAEWIEEKKKLQWLFSPSHKSIYVESIELASVEYNTQITVCPENNLPTTQGLHQYMKTNFCERHD